MRSVLRRFRPRALFACGLAAILVAGPSGPAPADDDDTPPYELVNAGLSLEDRRDLERVSSYLNSVTTMKGDFVQLSDSGGVATGSFYLRKPGRVRFEYDPPVPILFVSDGTLISIEDKEMETVNSYPLSLTPLKILLDNDVNLVAETRITSVEREPGELRITAREEGGLAEGELTMHFSDPDLELRQWVILDAQDVRTTVVLRNVEYGVDLAASLFTTTDYDFEDSRD